MGGFGSGRWSRQRSFGPEFARKVEIKQEGPPARPLSLSAFSPVVRAFFVEIDWRPFLCERCGAYRLGPSWQTLCGRCDPRPDVVERSAFGRAEGAAAAAQTELFGFP